jgi:hypothetical protein
VELTGLVVDDSHPANIHQAVIEAPMGPPIHFQRVGLPVELSMPSRGLCRSGKADDDNSRGPLPKKGR